MKNLYFRHLSVFCFPYNPGDNSMDVFTTPVKNRFSPRIAGRCEPERGFYDPAPLTRIVFDSMVHLGFCRLSQP
jgi:hypothetical protein